MLKNNAYAAYANNKIMTASKGELTLLLYDGAIKFCNMAIAAIKENDVQKAHVNIVKVEKIIEEFQSTLDHKYPIAKDFDNVYSYLHQRLVQANIQKDGASAHDARYMERSNAFKCAAAGIKQQIGSN